MKLFDLDRLPFRESDLEPFLSTVTVDFHYNKHHKTYLTILNTLLLNSGVEGETLEDVILNSYEDSKFLNIFNNAAQVWNHNFYWKSIKPQGGGIPNGELLDKIVYDFGSFDLFKSSFKQAGLSQFGSGWVWLVIDNRRIKILKTSNADLPIIYGQKPILTCDVWEHAYYLDYKNKRIDYLEIFLEHLINWDFVNENLVSVK